MPPKLRLFGKPILSTQICAVAHNPPVANSTEQASISLPGAKYATKKIYIKTSTLPSISASFDANQPIGTKSSLLFTLSQKDQLFEYRATSDIDPNNHTDCRKTDSIIECNLQDLQLTHGATQTIEALQIFRSKIHDSAYRSKITTLDPIQITSSSIVNDTKIYHSPE